MNKYTIPLLFADGLTTIILVSLIPNLAEQFRTPSGINALIVLVGYIFYCSGVFLLRKLAARAENNNKTDIPVGMTHRVFMMLAILFGIGMMLFLSQQLGYLDLIFTDPYSLGEGQAAAFFVFAPSAWLGVSLFYIPVLAFKVTPTIAFDSRHYLIQSFYSLLTTNGMLLLAVAQLKVLSDSGGGVWFLLALVLLTVWFGPPRWLYWQKRPSPLPLITFGLLLLICCWQIAT